jgi:hypothetical protein
MSAQLDILALEPFYGGARRTMLETIIRCSRHRWTLLRLPPRRIERRLTTAAIWFAEQLTRHWVGRVDLVFTSEALNLADLYRLMPALGRKPSVVYFHSNQLPDPNAVRTLPVDMVNLNTATAANEIWFNSLYHLRTFLAKASALVKRHPELSFHNPMPQLTGKAQLMLPPVDLAPPPSHASVTADEHGAGGGNGDVSAALASSASTGALVAPALPQRNKRRIFVETRDANVNRLNLALQNVSRWGEKFELITVGPVEELAPEFPRTTIPEHDDAGHAAALRGCGVFVSTKHDVAADSHAVRALAAGCWPLLPASGVYPELVPEILAPSCLYDGSADALASRLQDVWHLARPQDYEKDLAPILQKFEPAAACRAIDDRLEELAIVSSVGR